MALDARLEQLGNRHQKLEHALAEEMRHSFVDEYRVIELKREKLRIKDEIEEIRHRIPEH